MKYKRFEELPVWKDAIQLAVGVFALTAQPIFRRYRGVKDQIERAVVSISNNIAEGFERGTTPELLTFLYISRGRRVKPVRFFAFAMRFRALTISDLRSQI